MVSKKLKLDKRFRGQVEADMADLVELGDPENGFLREKSVRRLALVAEVRPRRPRSAATRPGQPTCACLRGR
eukprot:SAG11_NODE_11755_length_740_cov_0.847114_1_plen_71_part_01